MINMIVLNIGIVLGFIAGILFSGKFVQKLSHKIVENIEQKIVADEGLICPCTDCNVYEDGGDQRCILETSCMLLSEYMSKVKNL